MVSVFLGIFQILAKVNYFGLGIVAAGHTARSRLLRPRPVQILAGFSGPPGVVRAGSCIKEVINGPGRGGVKACNALRH